MRALTTLVLLLCSIHLTLGQTTNNSNTTDDYVNEVRTEGLNELIVEDQALSFFVIGDWGRNGYFHQKDVADIMHQTGFLVDPHMVISTGDNFYPNGVASTRDPYLTSSYEQIYSGYNLFCDWYVVLGNHDYRGNAQAQIDYTAVSQRWNMPARYFYTDRNFRNASVRFIFLDTSPFEDYYYKSFWSEKLVGQDTTVQKKWLEETLASSEATWNVVVGHHPLYTSGKRKDYTPYTRNQLEPIFEKYKVDVYFAGHEHDLQHQKPKESYTHYFVSGAGSEIRPTGESEYTKFAASIQGFMVASIKNDKMIVQVVDWQGQVLYKTTIEKSKED